MLTLNCRCTWYTMFRLVDNFILLSLRKFRITYPSKQNTLINSLSLQIQRSGLPQLITIPTKIESMCSVQRKSIPRMQRFTIVRYIVLPRGRMNQEFSVLFLSFLTLLIRMYNYFFAYKQKNLFFLNLTAASSKQKFLFFSKNKKYSIDTEYTRVLLIS